MRNIHFTETFIEDAAGIARYVHERFGEQAKNTFVEELLSVCDLITLFPGIGKVNQYPTGLIGFLHKHNWIFYKVDHDEVRFVHIVSSRRQKKNIDFL